MTTMPFGKYRGQPLAELPSGYVDWLQSKIDEWRDPFRSALVAELERRKGSTTTTATATADHATRRPVRRLSARRTTPELTASTVCDICGLRGTAERPLVHESCLDDGVPF
jgi:hypothetical protein